MKLSPCFYREKLFWVEWSPTSASLFPGWANFSYISLQSLANHLHEKQKLALTTPPPQPIHLFMMVGSPFQPDQVFFMWTLSLTQLGQLSQSETMRHQYDHKEIDGMFPFLDTYHWVHWQGIPCHRSWMGRVALVCFPGIFWAHMGTAGSYTS